MKKKQVKVESHAQAFYVGINNAADIRKTMLEGSKDLLISLRQYEHIKKVRTQKIALYAQYHTQISAIKTLVNKVQKAVPRHNLDMLAAPKKTESTVAKMEKQIESAPKVVANRFEVMDEVTRLESELSEIERKLSSI